MKRIAISIVRSIVHLLLLPLEWLLGAGKAKRDYAPIFIIGAPRSGTSLLYELMVTRFRFAFISNLSHRFYLTPIASAWLGRAAIEKWQGNFESRFGHIDGWGAPNEGGWVWRRWLRDADWTDGSDWDDTATNPLRKLVAGLTTVFDAPFLNKNVMHSNRLRLMQKIWPDAIYVHVRRNFADNARSIIRAERKDGGPRHDADHWWSVRPSNAPAHLGSDDIERAVAQVVGVETDIVRDGAAVAGKRLIAIEYAQLCSDPEAALQSIRLFLAEHGIDLQDRNTVPIKFSPPPSKPLNAGEEQRMLDLIAQLSNQPDPAS